jgi:hypothetical protein
MTLSKSKCWYSNNCLHFLKRALPLHTQQKPAQPQVRNLAQTTFELSPVSFRVHQWNPCFHSNSIFQFFTVYQGAPKGNHGIIL